MIHQPNHNNKQRNHTNEIHDIHITSIFRWTPPITRISTEMNCYSSHNYKQHSPPSNNRGSNITKHLIQLPKNLLLMIFNPKYRTKMKRKASQKQFNQKYRSTNSINFPNGNNSLHSRHQH
jgi:hypothetical protein